MKVSTTLALLLSAVCARYTYDNPEDLLKAGAGIITGVTTAFLVKYSDDPCFRSTVRLGDNLVDYGLVPAENYKETWFDWATWSVMSVGKISYFTVMAVRDCLGTDENFGWMNEEVKEIDWENITLKELILSLWTVDNIFAINRVYGGIKHAVVRWDTVDPFYVTRKLTTALLNLTFRIIPFV